MSDKRESGRAPRPDDGQFLRVRRELLSVIPEKDGEAPIARGHLEQAIDEVLAESKATRRVEATRKTVAETKQVVQFLTEDGRLGPEASGIIQRELGQIVPARETNLDASGQDGVLMSRGEPVIESIPSPIIDMLSMLGLTTRRRRLIGGVVFAGFNAIVGVSAELEYLSREADRKREFETRRKLGSKQTPVSKTGCRVRRAEEDGITYVPDGEEWKLDFRSSLNLETENSDFNDTAIEFDGGYTTSDDKHGITVKVRGGKEGSQEWYVGEGDSTGVLRIDCPDIKNPVYISLTKVKSWVADPRKFLVRSMRAVSR